MRNSINFDSIDSTLDISIPRHVRRITIALCLACAFGITGIRAQANGEYHFQQESLIDGMSFGHPLNSDPVPVLSMDCLAANGYGQWTLSSTASEGTSGPSLFPLSSLGFSCGGGFEDVGKVAQSHQSEAPLSPQGKCDCNPKYGDVPDSLCLFYVAYGYDGIDPLKERDSMMAYCEQHPFATTGYGMWRAAMAYVDAGAMDYWEQNIQQHDSVWSWNYWATMYDWYIKIQPMNPDWIYQDIVMSHLAGTASNFDLNLSCNLFYNFTLRFPQDSTGVVNAWEGIRLLRRQQSEIPEDTTPYSVLTFPLTPLQVAGVSQSAMPSGPMSLAIFPNPAGKTVTLNYEIPTSIDVSIIVFDATGRNVLKLSALAGSPQQSDLDVGLLPSGHYFVRLASGGDVITKELIVQH